MVQAQVGPPLENQVAGERRLLFLLSAPFPELCEIKWRIVKKLCLGIYVAKSEYEKEGLAQETGCPVPGSVMSFRSVKERVPFGKEGAYDSAYILYIFPIFIQNILRNVIFLYKYL